MMSCLVLVFPVCTPCSDNAEVRWLGHVRRMEDGRIPKDIIYGELALGRRTTGRPHLRYRNVCVRDMKAVDIDTMAWEELAVDRTKWKSALRQGRQTVDCSSGQASTQKGGQHLYPTQNHKKECHSHIGLFSHKQRCYNPARN